MLPKSPELIEKINAAPRQSGCYLFRDKDGTVIYVGKGKNVYKRVRQYFQKSKQNEDWEKIKRLVWSIEDVSFYCTETELDALLHEYRLIKKHRPFYNSQLKADKIHPYIRIDRTKEYATLSISPEKGEDDCAYFGFFYDRNRAKEALDVLHRAWKLPVCEKLVFPSKERACINAHLHTCMAPCTGKADQRRYGKAVQEAIDFLEGRDKGVYDRITAQMYAAAEAQEYKKAAATKTLLEGLQKLQRNCRKIYAFPEDRDMILFIRVYGNPAFSLYYIRSGRVAARQDFEDGLNGAGLREFCKKLAGPPAAELEHGWLPKALTEIFADKAFVEVEDKGDMDALSEQIKRGYTLFTS